MTLVGYKTRLLSAGTPTSFTDEPMTLTASSIAEYQITDTNKQVWDRKQRPVVKSGAGGSTVAVDSVDFLFGVVQLQSTIATPVVDGGIFYPTASVAGANSYTLALTKDILDDTDFDSTGWRSKQTGLRDANLSVTRWDKLDRYFFERLYGESASTGATRNEPYHVVAEVQPGGEDLVYRGYYIVETHNNSGDVASLESVDISLQLDGDPEGAFSYRQP